MFKEECINWVQPNVTGLDFNITKARRLANQDDQALTTLFAGQMQFSLNIFKAVFNTTLPGVQSKGLGDNLFFSPMSIYSALLLTYFGASNHTEKQLAQALGLQHMDKVNMNIYILFFFLLLSSGTLPAFENSCFAANFPLCFSCPPLL